MIIDSTTVVGSWVRSLPGIPDNKVNTVLPAAELWADTGFVQLVGVVGGTPMVDAAVRQPAFQLDYWACRLNSEKPPWDKASALAELVQAAIDNPALSSNVSLTFGAKTVRVLSVTALSEIRKIPQGVDTGDPASYARLTQDLQFMWVTLP